MIGGTAKTQNKYIATRTPAITRLRFAISSSFISIAFLVQDIIHERADKILIFFCGVILF